nr:unnamed protein product [Callosobruchus analis]
MGLINLVKERNRKYETAVNSKRQTSVTYDSKSRWSFVQVCRNTFMNIFDVTQKRLVGLIQKKKMGDTTFTEMSRTTHVPNQTSSFLSPDLNIHRLYKSFLQKNKTSTVSYKFYRGVFKKDFPNLSFHRPRVDTCHTCDRLSCESNQNNSAGIEASIQLDIYHRKVQKSMEYMKKKSLIHNFLVVTNAVFHLIYNRSYLSLH